jgi:lysozyme family protein
MTSYGSKWPEYARQWDAMIINPSRDETFRKLALKFIDLKPRYVPLANQTGIPWQIFAVMHMRESDNDFSKSLAQGDPWNQRSTNEPISGPFSSFEESAIWTMNHDGLTQVIDWRLEKQLWHLERLNGLGYAQGPTDRRTGIKYPPMPSPYIWGGTNQQRPGKYIADHVFDPNTMDAQPGCAPILAMIAKLDPSVIFVRETPMGVEPPSTPEPDMSDTPAAQPQVNIQFDWAKIERIAEGFIKFADMMEKRQTGQAPIALPAPPTDIAPAAAAAPSSLGGILSLALPIVTKALPMLGVQGGIWGTVGMLALQALNILGPATGPAATPTATTTAAGLGGIFASGLAGLVSRFLNRNKQS